MASDRSNPGPLASLTPEQQAAVVRIALMVHCRNHPARVGAVNAVLSGTMSVRRAAREHGVGRRVVSRLIGTFRDTLQSATAGGV